jgi:hypothetical protein
VNTTKPVAMLRVFDIQIEDGTERRHDAHALPGAQELPPGNYELVLRVPLGVAPLEVSSKRWPFVETPGEFTERLAAALNSGFDLLGAVRHVLIEEPPAFARGVERGDHG